MLLFFPSLVLFSVWLRSFTPTPWAFCGLWGQVSFCSCCFGSSLFLWGNQVDSWWFFYFFFHFIVGFNWLKSLAVSYCLLMLELCQNTKVLLENHIHFKLQSHGHSVMIRNSNNKDKAIVRRSHQASFKLRQN